MGLQIRFIPMNKKKLISDNSLINACILRSKYIIYAQSAIFSGKQRKLFLNRLPPNAALPSINSNDELNKELLVLIDGLKRDIANYLRPTFHAQSIEIGRKFWFSSQELADGYVLLSTKEMKKFSIEDCALLLSNVTYEHSKYLAGTIISLIKFNQIINLIEGVIENKTFIMHYAMRKMKKNGKK